MKRKTLLMAALMGGCSLQGMAQQITPKDVAGDKEYNRCRICGRPHAYLRKYGIC